MAWTGTDRIPSNRFQPGVALRTARDVDVGDVVQRLRQCRLRDLYVGADHVEGILRTGDWQQMPSFRSVCPYEGDVVAATGASRAAPQLKTGRIE